MAVISEYSEQDYKQCISVLLELLTILGEIRDHVVIVGGNVPPLLIQSAPEKHAGTLDIDLALDFRNIPDETYQRILDSLKKNGYYQKEKQPFIFFRDIEVSSQKIETIEINFLASEYGGTGKIHRHQKVQDIRARKARGIDLVFEKAIQVPISGRLPDGSENQMKVNVAAIGPFLVTKGMAIWNRKNEKDAYDIYYCLKYYPGGLEAITQELELFIANKLAREGLGKIRSKFKSIDSIGPSWTAAFLQIDDLEEKERVKREAFELVNELINRLGIEAFEDE